MEVQTWAIERITVRDRLRQDLGDLEDLKRSLTERGLINPITVEADGALIAGERRLRAAQQLGWDGIAVRVWRHADDAELLGVEAEENLCRKDLTPGEAELYAERLEELLKPEKGQGTRSDLGTSPKLGEVGRHDRETTRKAAKATGYSASTLKKVKEVRATAEDETQPEEVREEARIQHDRLMKGETKVAPAHTAVREKKRRQPKLATDLLPGQWIEPPPPPKPQAGLGERLVKAISKGQGLAELAAEVQDGKLDLGVETIVALRKRLREEIKERQQLNAALKGVLDNRKDSS